MMYVKKPGEPARDLSELCGDPWASGIINDAPDAAAVAQDLQQYDDWVDAQAAAAGVSPGTEAWETVRQAIRAKDTMGAEPGLMEHGHTLESTYSRRDFLEYSGDAVRRVAGAQQNFADGLWAEYAAIYGDEAANDPRLHDAVELQLQELKRHGYHAAQHLQDADSRREFLFNVNIARELGHRPYGDYGRTGGISGSGGYAPERSSTDGSHPYDDPDNTGMVAELRALQRKGGWL